MIEEAKSDGAEGPRWEGPSRGESMIEEAKSDGRQEPSRGDLEAGHSSYPDAQESYNVLGIVVENLDHKIKLERLFRLATLWLILVCIDHTANLVHVLVNADGLRACGDANAFTKAEAMDSGAFQAVMMVGYLFSFGVALSIPVLAFIGAKRRRREYVSMIRAFGVVFSAVSMTIMIHHFTLGASYGANQQDFDRKMHKSCAELSRKAGQLYMSFGFLAMLLAGIQCATLVASQRLMSEIDFWYIRAEAVLPAGLDGVVEGGGPRLVQPPQLGEAGVRGIVPDNANMRQTQRRLTLVTPVTPVPLLQASPRGSAIPVLGDGSLHGSLQERIPIARSTSLVEVSSGSISDTIRAP